MIVVMKPQSTTEHASRVIRYLDEMGLSSWFIEDAAPRLVEVLGANGELDTADLERIRRIRNIYNHEHTPVAIGPLEPR